MPMEMLKNSESTFQHAKKEGRRKLLVRVHLFQVTKQFYLQTKTQAQEKLAINVRKIKAGQCWNLLA
jgi:hypothetical protein